MRRRHRSLIARIAPALDYALIALALLSLGYHIPHAHGAGADSATISSDIRRQGNCLGQR